MKRRVGPAPHLSIDRTTPVARMQRSEIRDIPSSDGTFYYSPDKPSTAFTIQSSCKTSLYLSMANLVGLKHSHDSLNDI